MVYKCCEISSFIDDYGVDLLHVTETWLSSQCDETKTVELAPSGFDEKSFPRQSTSRGGGLQQNTNLSGLYRPPPNQRNNLTDSMYAEQLPDLVYACNLP